MAPGRAGEHTFNATISEKMLKSFTRHNGHESMCMIGNNA